jgi:cytochrome c-type biogenesis protein CcmH
VRARIISQDLRCLVCQNQSIDDSNAPLAKDLRVIVRERLIAGDSNEQVFGYVVARYGNYVLLKPPLQQDTLILWLAPFLLMIIALGVTIAYLRKRPELDDATSIDMKED